MIEWVFFDMGSTLIDETEADLHRIRDMITGTGVTEKAYCEKRFEMIRKGIGAYHEPQSCDELPEYTIRTLEELFNLI